MRRYSMLFVLIGSIFSFHSPSSAQTKPIVPGLANPAINVNAQFLAEAAPDIDRPYGLSMQETEIRVTSTVDPHWNLSAIFVIPGVEVRAEEVFATTTSVKDFQFKLGKMKTAFGKHGLLHAHEFPFAQAPLGLVNTLGEEGFNGSGVEASWRTPLPWSCELTAGGYRAVAADDDEAVLNFKEQSRTNIPWLARLKNSFDLSDNVALELGISSLTGNGDDGLKHAVYGGDLTVRSVSAHPTDQTGWILQAEYLKKVSFTTGVYDQERDGWYAFFQYRFNQQWWAGLRVEEAFNSPATELPGSDHLQRASFNLAWAPSGSSVIRGEYSIERLAQGNEGPLLDNRLMARFNYTIGAHPEHDH